MEKIKIGIYGLGKISHRVIQGIQCSKNSELYAVCSRSQIKANEFQKKYQAQRAYTSYEEMLKDESVDLVYICTPNYLHKEHILKALSANQNVICEKPMCLSSKDLKECFELAKERHCFLMEAHKTVFTPLNQAIFQKIQDGEIGKVIAIEAQYATRLEEEISSWHFDKPGAGCMYDIGVYPICFANFMANSSIHTTKRLKDQALIAYENGCIAHIATSWDCTMENTSHIYGSKGTITYANFWKSDHAYMNGTELKVEQASDFTGEIEHAATCIQKGLLESPIMSQRASQEILKVLEN